MNVLYLLSSIGEKIRAQRGKGTSPRSHSYQGTESGPNVICFVFFFNFSAQMSFCYMGPPRGAIQTLAPKRCSKNKRGLGSMCCLVGGDKEAFQNRQRGEEIRAGFQGRVPGQV